MNTVNPMKMTKVALMAVLCLSVNVLSSGCVRLQKSYPDFKVYSLDPSGQAHAGYSGEPVAVGLGEFSVASQFADRYLTYRSDEVSYESDFYHQMMTSPAVIIQNQTESWLKASPVVKFVLPSDAVYNTSYLISGKVFEFYGDYRQIDQPKAVLAIELTVTNTKADNNPVLLQKVYSESISMQKTSPKLLVEGWNQALGKILAEFEADLKALAASVSS
jgi:hypothetical protein